MNKLYSSYQENNANNQNWFSGFTNALQNLARQIMPTGMTPEQIVRQKIQNGEMTQTQFSQLGQMASSVMQMFSGRR